MRLQCSCKNSERPSQTWRRTISRLHATVVAGQFGAGERRYDPLDRCKEQIRDGLADATHSRHTEQSLIAGHRLGE